ncbi:ACT domain-containing protein [Bacillus sp. PS06]|uniref:ACT domain-containing protein n=1 Tax=Bacillus sp. PS06 TaxID=2764176 RepID=UPI00177FBBDE|nr:ACT domain-containing protein [Bacillus sp. PS06]MBD8069340.1 ACT domain-containing protein [Bacillus sp. PS06]
MTTKNNLDEKFYLVREDVLPEAIRKTLEAKELLERGKADSIAIAAQQVDLSRSAFYKYRDTVFPFHAMVKEQIISLFFHLEDRSGTLSELLSIVAQAGCNVLTIHQTIPLRGKANVTLSLNTSGMSMEITDLISKLKRLEFVDKVDILGTGA